MRQWILAATVFLSACTSTGVNRPETVGEVEARVRAYVASLGPARCTDPEPFYAFWTYDFGGVVLAESGKIVTLDARAHRAHNKDWFCSMGAQTGTVDAIVVQVLDSDHAISTWTFRETAVDKAGVTERIQGEVMQPWVRIGATWRSTGLVAVHRPDPEKGLPNPPLQPTSGARGEGR